MNFLVSLLQAAAGTGAQGTGQGGFWIMMILLFVIMWLFMIRPNRKQQKEIAQFRNSLKKGDKVVTAGGIYGTIDAVEETSVLLKVDGEVKLRVDKNSIQKDPSVAAPVEEKKK